MKRRGVIGVAAVGSVLLCGALICIYLQRSANADYDYAYWSPSPAAIRSRIGSASAPAPGLKDAERRRLFALMFKDRYRRHDPGVAIGLRFMSPTRLKLMCPARLEPFLVDQIALAAWREARDDFGIPVDIDIYDTFIGTAQIKIGQLRSVTISHPEVAHISYDYRSLLLITGPRPQVPVQAAPVMPIRRLRPRTYHLRSNTQSAL